MRGWCLPLLLFLLAAADSVRIRKQRVARQAFRRDSVEQVSGYPFRRATGSARRSDDTSSLMEYVWGGIGSETLPIREAVESLPAPLRTSEERSLLGTERLPLRDAVESRPPVRDDYSPSSIVVEDLFRSKDGYAYRITHSDPYYQYDPANYQIMPAGFPGQGFSSPFPWWQNPPRQTSQFVPGQIFEYPSFPSNPSFPGNGQNNPSFPGAIHGFPGFPEEQEESPQTPQRPLQDFEDSQLWNPEPSSDVDDDTVEILPARWEHSRSLVGKKNKRKNKKPSVGRNDIKGSSGSKVVCYLEGWANYRQEPMRFDNSKLDPFACTHVIYAFAAIDPHRFFIYPQDEEHDIIQGGYKSVVGLKRRNPNLRVLISIGGWSDDDPKFTKMTSSAANRQKFIRSVAKFLDKHNFDGIDIDWQYPGAEDMGGNRSDRGNLNHLVEELSEVFRLRDWVLSLAVPASRFRVDDGYEVQSVAPFVDLINIMAFGFHTERDQVADHHSPLFRRDVDRGLDVFFNADYAVQYWLKRGAPRSKIILGIPFFGRSFTLRSPEQMEIGSEVVGMGDEGRYTQEGGFMAYFEVCDNLRSGQWTKMSDSAGSPYMVNGNQWVGYDDVHSVKNKAEYIKQQRLGGAGLYAIDLDDFRGVCGDKWPLLKALKRGLDAKRPMPIKSTTTPAPTIAPADVNVPTTGSVIVRPDDVNCTGNGYVGDPNDCRVYHRCMFGSKTSYICPGGLHFDHSLDLCNYPDFARCEQSTVGEIVEKAAHKGEYKIVCYYTNWSGYRKGDGQFVPEHLDPTLCTHIVYAYSSLDPNQLMIQPFDPIADQDNHYYDRVTQLASRSTAKILLGLGGWTDSSGDKYSKMVADSSARRKFVTTTVAFLKQYGFQGLHIDWNYPKCWQSNCNKGPDSDRTNFASLIKELRSAFDAVEPPLTLASSISGYREVIDVAYDVPTLSRHLDFMSVMTFDYHGAWEKRTAHISPLYYRTGDSFPRFNTNYTLEYLTSLGADRKKLIMGIPFYGQSFTLANEKDNGYNSAADGPGVEGYYTRQPGMLAYYEICNNVRKKNWIVSRDAQGATGPYAFQSDQWVSYDDIESVTAKAKHIRNLGFGGAMAWTADLDDFRNLCCKGTFPLLKAIGRILGKVNDLDLDREDCTRPAPPVTPPAPITTTGVDSGAEYTTTPPSIVFPTSPTPTTSWPSWSSTSTSTTAAPSTSTSHRPTWTQRPTTQSTWPSWTSSTTQKPTTTSTTSRPWWEQTSTTNAPTTSTQSSTTESDSENVIPAKPCEPGRYAPDPNNCNAYYRCILGEFLKQYCVGGLHWNVQQGNCDWPENAKCDRENIVFPDPTTSKRPQWTTTTESQWTSTTQYPQWTSTTTRQPASQRPTTSRPTSTSTTQPTPEEGPCINGEYYSVPGSCESFAICVNGRKVQQRCAGGLFWNQQQKYCDWSRNVMCASAPTDRIVEDGKVGIQDRPCQSGSYAPYPGDCNKYLSCLWGTYSVFSCAPGLHWNTDEKTCDWPNPAKCKDLVGSEGGSSDGVAPAQPPSFISTTVKPAAPTRPPTTVPPPSTSQDGYFKIVCYFTNWAWYRQGEGKYMPEDIDFNLCTHIIYGFAVLDYENLVIKPHDSWADLDNKFYERVVAFKKKGLKVSLAIGGWNDSQGDKYSRLVNNPAARARFTSTVIEFLQKYDFDGLDLDWEYPKCWQVDCSKGPDSDKAAFSAWIKELHDAFAPHGLLLSSAVSPSKTVMDAGYDVAALGQYLDWIAVMTYDYHGQWDKKTGHVAPMYFHENDDFFFFNANYSINYWISEGAPRRKIVMGMPLYGQSFQLANENEHGLNANAPGPGQAGEYTRANGFLAYYEICDRVQNQGWTIVQDNEKRMGPYAYKGNQWVSYDDAAMIKLKSEYIRSMDLGGGMVWALDLDDFRNKCGGGRHPLLSTIRETLGPAPSGVTTVKPIPTKPPGDNDVVPPMESSTSAPSVPPPMSTVRPELPTVSTTTGLDLTTTPKVDQTTQWSPNSEYKVVCYFTNWAWYRQGIGKFLPGDIDPQLCTHIIYGFAVLDGDQLTIKPHDTWADFDNQFYKKVTEFKNKGVKVLVAIGGWNDSAGDKYSRLVNNPAARSKFVSHVVAFIEKHNFDGLDLDWEYPKCWQVNCKMGPDSDKPAFAAFVRELRSAFNPKRLLLSAAVSPNRLVIDGGYDVPSVARDLDWISVMTYDYHGQWDKITGHVAPMYPHPDDIDVTFNANFSINYWINQGADRKKIVMGMPMYGQSFSLADNSDHGLNAPTYGGGEAGDQTRARGFLAYYEICHRIRTKNWKVVHDKKNRIGPYAYLRDQWVGFDDQPMIQRKSEFIREMGLGGGMIWALDLDDFRDRCQCETYPLLKTINRVLRNYPVPQPKCSLQGPSTEDNEIIRAPDVVPTKIATAEADDLSCGGRIFADYVADCNKYYQCEHGKLHLMSCPNGLYWNKDHCDWPQNTDCRPDSDNEVFPGSGVPVPPSLPSAPSTTTEIATTSAPVATTTHRPAVDSKYKVVCYFTNWAWYRQGVGKFTPDNIDYELCTHIAYGFAVLDGTTLTIKPHDSWADLDNEFYRKVTELKNKGIKVLIAIGGWNDSLGNKYSRLVADPNSRRRFIENVIQFIDKYGFEGLDLDWEYPKCWQVDCNQGPEADKPNFATFVRELSEAFKPRGLLLSSAVSPSKLVIDMGYDVPTLSKYFDYISIMTYDFHGHWDKATGHVAPLYHVPGDTYDYFNANFSINYWIEQGADRQKLIMGMPLYGQSFSLTDASVHGLNSPASGPGEAGEFTRAAGFLAFYEICEKVKRQGWTVVRDEQGRIGPYAHRGNQWVSYDDVSEIRRKSQIIKQLGLGGGMIWALDLDDFRNRCGCGTHPLLKTMNQELRGVGGTFNDCT